MILSFNFNLPKLTTCVSVHCTVQFWCLLGWTASQSEMFVLKTDMRPATVGVPSCDISLLGSHYLQRTQCVLWWRGGG